MILNSIISIIPRTVPLIFDMAQQGTDRENAWFSQTNTGLKKIRVKVASDLPTGVSKEQLQYISNTPIFLN